MRVRGRRLGGADGEEVFAGGAQCGQVVELVAPVAQQGEVDEIAGAVVDLVRWVVRVGAGVELLRDLVVDDDAGEPVGGREAEVRERRRRELVDSGAGAAFVGGDLDGDAAPHLAAQGQLHVEASRLDDPTRPVDLADLGAGQLERSPRLDEGSVERGDEVVELAAEERVDVPRGSGRQAELHLEVGAALEEEPGLAVGVDGSLQRGDHDAGGDQPAEPAAGDAGRVLGLRDPAVEDPFRLRQLPAGCELVERPGHRRLPRRAIRACAAAGSSTPRSAPVSTAWRARWLATAPSTAWRIAVAGVTAGIASTIPARRR